MTESLEQLFTKASVEVKDLTKRPSNDDLLCLYAFYKQATEGDVKGERPGMFSVKDRAKYDAWAKIKGRAKQDCQQQYVDLVSKLKKSS